MATGETQQERRTAVADFAGKLFGVPVPSANVVEERLERVIPARQPLTPEALRAGVLELPAKEWAAFEEHPLAAWIEDTFGLEEEDGQLRRRVPISMDAGAELLSEQTGLDVELSFTLSTHLIRSPNLPSIEALKNE